MGLLDPPPRDPNKFDKMFTDWGGFLNGIPKPLPFILWSTGLGCTLGGGGLGGGTFRDVVACDAFKSKGSSSQFVVGVYRWLLLLLPAPTGGGAGAGLVGTVVLRIWRMVKEADFRMSHGE